MAKSKTPRIRLSTKEFELIQSLRVGSDNSGIHKLSSHHKALQAYCEENQIPFESVNHYWHKGKNFSLHVKGEEGPTYMEMRQDAIREMNEHAPSYPKIVREKKITSGHLFLLDPADVHIGKLARSFEVGVDYNQEIAVNRVIEGTEGLIIKASGYDIDKVAIIIGNDILHTDTTRRTTTSLTPQDTDGMWYENFLKAKRLYIDVIERLLTIADVHVIFNPSNHDYMSGFFLADSISSWFSKCNNVTFDVSIAHRKYFRYGNNLIGSTHGDGAKEADLPLIMAHESKDWSSCKHKYFYTHHLHHNKSKDYMGVNVTLLRSPSEADSWHSKSGYEHAPKAIEAFIHHPEFGRSAHLTHIF